MNKYFAALLFTTALNLLAVSRMLAFRVQRKLFFLVAFLVFQFAQSLTLIFMTRSLQSTAYQEIYEVTEPLNWVLYVLIVREMYSRAFANFPGIASVSRWATFMSAGLAALLCIILAFLSPNQDWPHKQVFGFVELWGKFVTFALAAFILLMVYLVSRYPIKLDFNVAFSIATFAVYFFGSFVFLEIGTIGTVPAIRIQTVGLLVVFAICFSAWAIFLRRTVESDSVRVRSKLNPFEEQRLMDQLAFLDNMLVKSARD